MWREQSESRVQGPESKSRRVGESKSRGVVRESSVESSLQCRDDLWRSGRHDDRVLVMSGETAVCGFQRPAIVARANAGAAFGDQRFDGEHEPLCQNIALERIEI